MSENFPSNRFTRINKSDLLSDSNTTKIGSVRTEVSNPSMWNLRSRIGGDLDSSRMPLPGYCIHFDKTNPNAYIQTAIPSSERDLYEIIIKGEGNIDLLYVDTSDTNISIKQKQILSETSSLYFNLSYIAFIDRTSGIISNLFECEESSGTILYDATCNISATINGVTDITTMRISSNSKEFIINEEDLYNTFMGKDYSYAHFVDADLRILPSIFSIVADVKFDFTYEEFKSDTTNSYIFSKPESTQNNFLYFYKRNSNLALHYKTNNGTEVNHTISEDNTKLLFDNAYHKIILSFGANTVNLYFDSTLIATITRPIIEGFGDIDDTIQTSNISLCGPNNTKPILMKGFDIYNYDILSTPVSYSITDINSGKQIPESLIKGTLQNEKIIVSLRNIGNGVWLDQSLNNKIAITYTSNIQSYPNKRYGTWLNAVGYTLNNNVYIPRKVL